MISDTIRIISMFNTLSYCDGIGLATTATVIEMSTDDFMSFNSNNETSD